MPRKKVDLTGEHPFHIGARCINREWFEIPKSEVWQIYEYYLHFIHHAFGIEILSFVLMSNHFHLLLRAPDQNLSVTMRYFMRETSRQISSAAERINQTYGARFYRSQIQSLHYFFNAYKYVYRNPVEANLIKKVENYEYSTLTSLLGSKHSIIPLSEDLTLFSDPHGTLNWLNTADKESHDAVRKALRRPIMTFGKTKNGGKPHPLTERLY